MPDHPRIEALRRRVQKDPASIAFAQLAEEYRRAGRFKESIETCRAGLANHPGYLSARVTLGRALVDAGDLDAAQAELQIALRAAPENLVAIRGLAEIHQRRNDHEGALAYYRTALGLAPHDPELEDVIEKLSARLSGVGKPLSPTAAAPPAPVGPAAETPEQNETRRLIATLERWLDAIHADGEHRPASG